MSTFLSRSLSKFPASSLAELLMLSILAGLTFATWMNVKLWIESPTPQISVNLSNKCPRAALSSDDGLRVIDCLTGKVLLARSQKQLSGRIYAPSLKLATWYRWPSGDRNGMGDRFASRRMLAGAGTSFTPNLDVDFRQGVFGSAVPAGSGFWPHMHDEFSVDFKMGAVTFNESGDAIAIQVTERGEDAVAYKVIDLAKGKETSFRQSKDKGRLTPALELLGDRFVVVVKDKIVAVIDPATGIVENSQVETQFVEAKRNSTLPLPVIAPNGSRQLLTSWYSSGVSLITLPEEATKREVTDLRGAKVIHHWVDDPKICWRGDECSMIFCHTSPFAELDALESSNIWLLRRQEPYVSRAKWPIADNEFISFPSKPDDLLGVTALRYKRHEESLEFSCDAIVWDVAKGIAATIPPATVYSRKVGEHLIALTDSHLHVIDLNTGKKVNTIKLSNHFQPPLGIVWGCWFLGWIVLQRRSAAGDAAMLAGLSTAGVFLALMGLACYSEAGLVAWLLQVVLLTALLIGLVVAAFRRAASVINLLVLLLITSSLLTSSALLSRESIGSGGVMVGKDASHATVVWDKIFAPPASTATNLATSIRDSLIAPKATSIPAPKVIGKPAAKSPNK